MEPLLARYGLKMLQHLIEGADQILIEEKGERKAEGLVLERRGDPRTIITKLGPLQYRRAYYQNQKTGGYVYPLDQIVGVSPYQRVEKELSKELVSTSRHQSYQRAVDTCCEGMLSKQTVLSKIRKAVPVIDRPKERKAVPFLHIDADEDHVALQGSRRKGRVNVPLVSVYEGIASHGTRKYCKEVFHISAYGKKPEALWEEVLSRMEERYDLSNTQIYLHGDGAGWIAEGLEWLPKVTFVLDAYHKNKYITGMLAGCDPAEKRMLRSAIVQALHDGDEDYFGNAVQYLIEHAPQHKQKILEAARYLEKHREAIAIRHNDPQARNGGCTEPHVSHVLSARLSSRPKGWSEKTLLSFAPILANGSMVDFPKLTIPELSKAAMKAAKKVQRQALTKRCTRPNASLPILQFGKRSPLFHTLYGIVHTSH
jgi:hypothetical protein